MTSFPIDNERLGDLKIRRALVRRLSASPNLPKVILEELHVHNGNAIADVVTVHTEAHCYEIKGETDRVSRIEKQGALYNLVFAKITLVTTENQFASAKKFAPAHWGIMIARERNGEVAFTYSRSAKTNPAVDKRLALLTLWKSELAQLAEAISEKNSARLTREQLSVLIAGKLSKTALMRAIGKQLASRRTT